MKVDALALVAASLLGGLALFQIALALGAPMGRVVFGGRVAQPDGRLPVPWRIGSAIASLVLVGFAWVILARGGVITTRVDETLLTVLAWMVVAYLAVNTAANALSSEPVERYLFGGISGVLVVICAIVAASGPT